jgi:prepilin-type N-terminal cleavage/methylation domain-containing protein
MEKNQDKGFTLVELLIVIVILGILATVTVFAVRGITDKGQDNACSVEKRTLDTAIESYYAQNQTDPASVADLTPTYLKSAPDTTKWTFSASSAGSAEVLRTPGPDLTLGAPADPAQPWDGIDPAGADDTPYVPAVAAGSASFTAVADPGKCAGTV